MAIPAQPFQRANEQAALERGIRKIYFRAYKDRVGEYEAFYNMDTSVKQQETDAVFAGLGQFTQKVEGDGPTFDNGSQAYTKVYTHLTFAMGLKVTREAQEDDLYGVVGQLTQDM